jgi:hypothetical protein
MDLRGGDPESTRSACVKLRDLAVAAEGPGAPFTATARGQQLLRLIHIVVQNVGLEDKVGALTALRLLKADDTLLQRLLKEGILPPLLAIIARDAADADGDWDGSVVADAGAAHLRLVRAETAAAAARAVEAFSSSGDSLTTLLRGGAVEALSDRLCRARGELADAPPARVVGENAENAENANDALGKARAAAAASCDVALARISGSNLASAQDRDPFGNPLDDPLDGMDPDSLSADAKETRRSRAAAATSTARSLLCLLESDAVVAHRAAAAGLAKLASSGRAGRIATARCGAVLPLMTAALAGNAAQRAAALAALDAISSRGERGADGGGDAAMGDADDHEQIAGDLEMDDNGGVQSAADASRAAKDAETAALEAVNAKANARASSGVTGTAAKVGVTFFAHLIEVLAGLTQLRGSFIRAAADASLALWALAWQPSNRRSMSGEEVIAPLVALYALEGERAGAAAAAAADDAGAVLGVLARLCERSRESIEYADPTNGKRLVRHLLDGKDPESPISNSGSNVGGGGGGGVGDNAFGFSREKKAFFSAERGDAEKPGGPSDPDELPNASTSPNIRRTISGQHVAAAIARASPHK